MTIVVVQCRLDSSRLPRKALLPLGGRPLLAWTLASMKKVPAHRHVLAVDYDSYQSLAPIAKDCGWDIVAGPKDDVLERFCIVATDCQCIGESDTVLRATADNPFLFYEAAVQLLEEMASRSCDYITFTGLPHGSGVEAFNARSLLEVGSMSRTAYDREHVGPAFYQYPQDFVSVMVPAPDCWHHPELRTTVDTAPDYRRSLRIVRHLSCSRWPAAPYTAGEVLSALSVPSIANPILCVPTLERGRGTGHLRRCLDIARETGADVLVKEPEVVLPAGASGAGWGPSPELQALIDEAERHGIEPWRFVNSLPDAGEYSLILADYFSLDKKLAQRLFSAAPVAAVDEGSSFTAYCDYLLDIIPSHKLVRQPNLRNSSFIPLPKNRREPAWCTGEDGGAPVAGGGAALFSKILVSAGGEDPSGLSIPAAIALGALGKEVTVIVSNPAEAKSLVAPSLQKNIRIIPPVENLREKLFRYDVVVTHYGFTAFEALAAGCGVVLLGTSSLHLSLGKRYGFAALSRDEISADGFQSLLERPWLLYPRAAGDAGAVPSIGKQGALEDFVQCMAAGSRILCPICGTAADGSPHPVLARIPERTFRRCSRCGIMYMGWTFESIQPDYSTDYFFEDYRKQYGKTYLEDFSAIRSHGVRRMAIVDTLFWMRRKEGGKMCRQEAVAPSVLDIGCAYGPFLSAGVDAGWQVFGTDISPGAVEYVQNTLHFPAACASFPEFDPVKEFGMSRFNAITMWYVIEHFRQLGPVLEAVSKLLEPGGIFAFSTPSASGVSAQFAPHTFFSSSPPDHYTLWEPRRAKEILQRFGFKVVKVVSTGHHPERFPLVKGDGESTGCRPGSLLYSLLARFSRCFFLGDTFEVYCIKTKELE